MSVSFAIIINSPQFDIWQIDVKFSIGGNTKISNEVQVVNLKYLFYMHIMCLLILKKQ